jgi:hypothetical protein
VGRACWRARRLVRGPRCVMWPRAAQAGHIRSPAHDCCDAQAERSCVAVAHMAAHGPCITESIGNGHSWWRESQSSSPWLTPPHPTPLAQVKDPAKRATLAQVLAHPWMAGAASSDPMGSAVLNNMKKFMQTNLLKKAAMQVGEPRTESKLNNHVIDASLRMVMALGCRMHRPPACGPATCTPAVRWCSSPLQQDSPAVFARWGRSPPCMA